jgi:hypothetical protein
MKRIHILDSTATRVRADDELVVAIGDAAAAHRGEGVAVVSVESAGAAALFVHAARPAVLRLSLADPLGFLDVLRERDGAQARLVA